MVLPIGKLDPSSAYFPNGTLGVGANAEPVVTDWIFGPTPASVALPSLTGGTSGDSTTGAATYDLTITIPSGQSLLIVDQGFVPTTNPVSVTLDPAGANLALSTAGAKVTSSATSTGRGVQRYYLVNPPAGTWVLRGVLSGAVLQTLNATWWTNTDTTTPLGTQVSANSTTGNTIKIATGDVPFFFGALGLRSTTAPVANAAQLPAYAKQSSTNQQFYGSYKTTGGDFGYSWAASDENVLLGHQINAAASLASVSQAIATSWNVLATTTAVRSTLWNVLAVVSASRSTLWNVLSAVSKALSTTWNVRSTVTAARSTLWNVAAALTQVTKALSTLWNVNATVAAARSTSWNVNALVAKALSTSWNVRSLATAARSTLWNVQATIAAARSTSWHVLQRVGSAGSIAYVNSTKASAQSAAAALTVSMASQATGHFQTLYVTTSNNAVTCDTPAGWTPLHSLNSTAVFYRYNDGSEAASLNLTFTGGTTRLHAIMLAHSGVDPTNPFGTTPLHGIQNGGTANPQVSPSLTNLNATDWYIVYAATRESTALNSGTAGSGITIRQDAEITTSTFTSLVVADTNGGVTPGAHTYSITMGTAPTSSQNGALVLNAATAAGVSRSTLWNVRALVSASRSTSWNVLSALVAVSRAMSTSWNVLAQTVASRSTLWNVRRLVSQPGSTYWHVRERITDAHATSWNVRAFVTKATSTTWNVNRLVSAARSTLWHVRVAVVVERSTAWNVVKTVSRSLSTTWNTLFGANGAPIFTKVSAGLRLNRRDSASVKLNQRASARIDLND